MRPPSSVRAPVKTSSVGACLLGLVLLLSACASQQAAAATPAGVASPTVPVVTPFPTATGTVPPTIAPNATAIAAGCGSGPFLGQSPLPGLPLPAQSFVQILNGITGNEQEIGICTAASTRAAISQFMNTALPAAGWTPYDPTKDAGCPSLPGVVFHWVKGEYAITLDFTTGLILPLPPHFWGLIYCAGVQPA
jgi:hypothetical protein